MGKPVDFSSLEDRYQLPSGLLSAVMDVESAGNVNAVSPKGAVGPFQFMPKTAAEFGLTNPRDVSAAADAAARKLSGLIRWAKGDLPTALAGWNYGEGNVQMSGGKLPAETKNFVQKVTSKIGPADFDPSSAKPVEAADDFDPASAKPVEVQAAPQQQATQPPPATIADRARALIGGANKGISGLLGLPVDTVQNVINLGKAGVGTIATAAGFPDAAPALTTGAVGGSEWIANKLKSAGIGTENPRPDDRVSRMLYQGGVVGGGSMVPGAGVGSTAAAGISSAVAQEVLGPQWAGLGAMVPAATVQAAQGVKQAMAGNAAQNIDTFKRAGVTPSAGQATESNFFRGLENLVSKFPGGTGVMRKFSESQQSMLGDMAKRGTANAESAGRAIETGIKGENGFLARTKATWQQLDDAVAQKVGGSTVTPTETIAVLDRLTSQPVGATNMARVLNNPRLTEIKSALYDDIMATPGQAMPYESARALRTKVGALLDDSLVSGVPNGEIKTLYRALSKDLEAAANAAGAGKEFARQNNYYSARMSRIEGVLEKVIGKDKLPEDIFRSVNPTNPDQANRIRAVMRSLEPAERSVVSEAIINRMGRSTPGRQNEMGDVWSSETFLTNWNKLSGPAKSQVMPDLTMRKDMDAIASVASNIREGSKVFANPSGTAGAVAPYGLAAMAAAGHLATPAILIGGAHLGGKLLTNPQFVNWLAKSKSVTPQEMAPHLARLGVIYNKTSDPDTKAEIGRYLESVQAKVDQQQ